MPKGGGDRFDQLPKDDPNYDIARRFHLEGWADSHGVVADTLAGQVSFSDWVESCIKTFQLAAATQVAFKDEIPPSQKCQAVDRMAKLFIRRFEASIRSYSKGLGKANAKAAIDRLSRRVHEIAARSKQQIFQHALKGTAPPNSHDDILPAGSRSPLTRFPNDEATPVYPPTGPDRGEVRKLEDAEGLHKSAKGLAGRVESQNPVAEEIGADTAKGNGQVGNGTMTRMARAKTVARVIKELNVLKPQLFEDEEEYRRLENQYSDFLSFSIARNRPDLKRKILAIQGSRRHIKLALEIVAGLYSVSPGTVEDDWKDCKPKSFRRPKGPVATGSRC